MRFPSGTISGILIGASMGSLLLLAGYIVRDRQPEPPRCRDGIRFLQADDTFVPCLTPGAAMQLVEIGGRAAAICTCGPTRTGRAGATELL